ncbi:hypothetical protein GALMADRAFT_1131686 [Galerina marginata CBS 339.88]|uniref:Uncharacterized protein n=1 Tax=Galerina marginata (strain CBS 339.88) TaxID=685588 RepID=A0A067S7Y4_GALM3|nr:hypothetical protein GALMADRAFT_1131686 [Galerina marginata CBS 339.88]
MRPRMLNLFKENPGDGGNEGEFEPGPGTPQGGPSIPIWFFPPLQTTPDPLPSLLSLSLSITLLVVDAISEYGRPLGATSTQQHLNLYSSACCFPSDFTVATKCLLIQLRVRESPCWEDGAVSLGAKASLFEAVRAVLAAETNA